LRARQEGYGDEVSVLEKASPGDAWHASTVTRFNSVRHDECEKVVDEPERLRVEIARERPKGKLPFADLEDEESNVELLKKSLVRGGARDACGATRRMRSAREVGRCPEAFDALAREIYGYRRVAEDEERR
jgi:hypothetical protein